MRGRGYSVRDVSLICETTRLYDGERVTDRGVASVRGVAYVCEGVVIV